MIRNGPVNAWFIELQRRRSSVAANRLSKGTPMFARCVTTCLALAATAAVRAEPLLIISIDGLHPSHVIDAQRHGAVVPNLRVFVDEGTFATGVVGVLPTVTFPSHTTLVTGVNPAEHGIYANTPFDPLNTNRDGWYWYAEDVRVPTLWGAAAARGLTTASLNWSVTVANRDIDFLIPEFWRAVNDEDLKLLRALSRPEGLLEGLEAKLGPFVNGYEDSIAADVVRTKFAVAMLREHQPDLMTVHLIALDGTEHRDGPWVASAHRTLEAIDTMVGELVAAAEANDPDSAVAVVSDHGFIATHTAVNLRVPFVAAGLIALSSAPAVGVAPTIADWQAQIWPSGGTAAVVLRDRGDTALRARVAQLLDELHADAANGIARVLATSDIERRGAAAEADFIVEFAPGFYSGTALHGELRTPATSKGTHGYLPERPEMHASFFMKGKRIAARDVGAIDMRQIAPTFAAVLGVALPQARLPSVSIRSDARLSRAR
jgi:predicted AlkP superfamily pyrophosphatase or phosphodiesterase